MVHTTVRPVSTVLRTARITIAAALASSPGVQKAWTSGRPGDCYWRSRFVKGSLQLARGRMLGGASASAFAWCAAARRRQIV